MAYQFRVSKSGYGRGSGGGRGGFGGGFGGGPGGGGSGYYPVCRWCNRTHRAGTPCWDPCPHCNRVHHRDFACNQFAGAAASPPSFPAAFAPQAAFFVTPFAQIGSQGIPIAAASVSGPSGPAHAAASASVPDQTQSGRGEIPQGTKRKARRGRRGKKGKKNEGGGQGSEIKGELVEGDEGDEGEEEGEEEEIEDKAGVTAAVLGAPASTPAETRAMTEATQSGNVEAGQPSSLGVQQRSDDELQLAYEYITELERRAEEGEQERRRLERENHRLQGQIDLLRQLVLPAQQQQQQHQPS